LSRNYLRNFDRLITGVESFVGAFRFSFCSTPSGLYEGEVPLLPRVSPAVIIVEAFQASWGIGYLSADKSIGCIGKPVRLECE